MEAVSVSTKGDHYMSAQHLNKGDGNVVFILVCILIAREVYTHSSRKGSQATERSLPLKSINGDIDTNILCYNRIINYKSPTACSEDYMCILDVYVWKCVVAGV